MDTFMQKISGSPLNETLSIKFSVISEESKRLDPSVYPFVIASDADSVAKLVEGSAVTAVGQDLERLFLLIQRDKYPLAGEGIWAKNNKEIDDAWQRAFSLYRQSGLAGSMFVISDQIDDKGRILPLKPLLFCRRQNVFFHPLCPECGMALHQCYNDTILSTLGLKPYSTSLARYLFCHTCFFDRNLMAFYAYDRAGDDPAIVRDRKDLFKSFAFLLKRDIGVNNGLPCSACPDQNNCYDKNFQVLTNLEPLSFYPFFMLVFKAGSLNAMDFFPALSGASIEELIAIRSKKQDPSGINYLNSLKGNELLFGGTERGFQEILYYKLSFLLELAREAFSQGSELLDINNLDNIWVRLIDHNILPMHFLDFHVNIIGIPKAKGHSPDILKTDTGDNLHPLGFIWFYTLLFNKGQGISKIGLTIKKIISLLSVPGFTLEKIIDDGSIETLLPQNIFWQSGEVKGLNEHFSLWKKALLLGWELLTGPVQSAEEGFIKKIKSLIEEASIGLYKTGEVASSAIRSEELEIDPIYDIINRILNKWHGVAELGEDHTEKPVYKSDGVAGESGIGKGTSEKEKKVFSAEETVVFGEDGQVEKEVAPGLLPSEDVDEEFDKTVILPAGFVKESEINAELSPDETIVMTPDLNKKGVPGTELKKPLNGDIDEDLIETVIIPSDDIKGSDHSVSKLVKKEAPLDETIAMHKGSIGGNQLDILDTINNKEPAEAPVLTSGGNKAQIPLQQQIVQEEGDIEETIIQRPLNGRKPMPPEIEPKADKVKPKDATSKGLKEKEAGSEKKTQEIKKDMQDDFFTETVIPTEDEDLKKKDGQ